MSSTPRATPRPVGGSVGRRRAISTGTVATALLVVVTCWPLLVLAAWAADVVTRRRGHPHLRLLALIVLALGIELAVLVGAAGTWVIFGGGRPTSRAARRTHFAMQRWWTGALLTAAERTVGLRVLVEDPTPAAAGNAIVIGRHTSIGDAAIPAVLLGNLLGLDARYVLKRQLQWSPGIDIIGHRLPHHFVERNTDDNRAELAAIREIGRGLDDRSSVVLFPEGTFFSPSRKDRAIERLRAGGRPELADRAAQLRHLLPPRPAGTLALLDAAPDADVVVIGHVGFEQCGSLAAIYRAVPFTEPVWLWTWRVPRAEIPDGDDARLRWLYDQWARLDASITERMTS